MSIYQSDTIIYGTSRMRTKDIYIYCWREIRAIVSDFGWILIGFDNRVISTYKHGFDKVYVGYGAIRKTRFRNDFGPWQHIFLIIW